MREKLYGLFILFIMLSSVVPVNSVPYFNYEDHGTVISQHDDLISIIDNSSSGTVITLEDGIYEVNRTILLDKNITIKAENPFKTMIKGHNGSVISNHGANVSLIGLVITGGNDSGIKSTGGYLNMDKCNITNNSVPYYGGGLFLVNTHFNITNSTINNNKVMNTVDDQGGNCKGAGLLIRNSEGDIIKSDIMNNGFSKSDYSSSGGDGGGLSLIDSNCSVDESNIMYNNENVRYGGGVNSIVDGSLNITKSNITNNAALYGGGVYCDNHIKGRLNFNRLTNNTGGYDQDFHQQQGSLECNVDYNWWGDNNVNDTQTNLIPLNHYNSYVNVSEGLDKRTIHYNIQLNNSENVSFPMSLNGKLIVNGTNQTLFFDGSKNNNFNCSLDTKYELKIDNYYFCLEGVTKSGRVYVNQVNGNDTNNGLTPESGLKTMTRAINMVTDNGEIILCNDYKIPDDEQLIVTKNIGIKSQEGKTYTLNGRGNNGSLFCYGVNLALENMKISGGDRANGAGVASIDSNLTVKNCVFEDNNGVSLGGAILSLPYSNKDSFLHVYDSNFIGNKGGDGSAIYSYTNDLELHNLNFTDNTYTTNTSIVNCFADKYNVTDILFHERLPSNSPTGVLSPTVLLTQLYTGNDTILNSSFPATLTRTLMLANIIVSQKDINDYHKNNNTLIAHINEDEEDDGNDSFHIGLGENLPGDMKSGDNLFISKGGVPGISIKQRFDNNTDSLFNGTDGLSYRNLGISDGGEFLSPVLYTHSDSHGDSLRINNFSNINNHDNPLDKGKTTNVFSMGRFNSFNSTISPHPFVELPLIVEGLLRSIEFGIENNAPFNGMFGIGSQINSLQQLLTDNPCQLSPAQIDEGLARLNELIQRHVSQIRQSIELNPTADSMGGVGEATALSVAPAAAGGSSSNGWGLLGLLGVTIISGGAGGGSTITKHVNYPVDLSVDIVNSSVEANRTFSFNLHAKSNNEPIYDTTYTVDLYDGDSLIKKEDVDFKDGVGKLNYIESDTGNHNYKIKIEPKKHYDHKKDYYNYDYSYYESNSVNVPVDIYTWTRNYSPVSLSMDPISGSVHVDDNLQLTLRASSGGHNIKNGVYNLKLYDGDSLIKIENVNFTNGVGKLSYTAGSSGNHTYKVVMGAKDDVDRDYDNHVIYGYNESTVRSSSVFVDKWGCNLTLSIENQNNTFYNVGLCLNLTRSDGRPVDDGQYSFIITETNPNYNINKSISALGNVNGGVMRFNYPMETYDSSLNISLQESRKYKSVSKSITPNIGSGGETISLNDYFFIIPKLSKILNI